nr:MAG TPA: hypothetical protein [Caudoviricetes sp.]
MWFLRHEARIIPAQSRLSIGSLQWAFPPDVGEIDFVDMRKIIAQVPENFSQSIFGLAEYQAQIQPLLADFDAA